MYLNSKTWDKFIIVNTSLFILVAREIFIEEEWISFLIEIKKIINSEKKYGKLFNLSKRFLAYTYEIRILEKYIA